MKKSILKTLEFERFLPVMTPAERATFAASLFSVTPVSFSPEEEANWSELLTAKNAAIQLWFDQSVKKSLL